MKFNELICLTSTESSNQVIDSCLSKDNVYIAKELFQEHMPTYTIDTISGKEIVLSDHFSDVLVIALSTDLMERMGKKEKSIFKDFVSYEDYLYSGLALPALSNSIYKLIAIDKWLYNEVMNIENRSISDDTTCGNNTLSICDFIK